MSHQGTPKACILSFYQCLYIMQNSKRSPPRLPKAPRTQPHRLLLSPSRTPRYTTHALQKPLAEFHIRSTRLPHTQPPPPPSQVLMRPAPPTRISSTTSSLSTHKPPLSPYTESHPLPPSHTPPTSPKPSAPSLPAATVKTLRLTSKRKGVSLSQQPSSSRIKPTKLPRWPTVRSGFRAYGPALVKARPSVRGAADFL